MPIKTDVRPDLCRRTLAGFLAENADPGVVADFLEENAVTREEAVLLYAADLVGRDALIEMATRGDWRYASLPAAAIAGDMRDETAFWRRLALTPEPLKSQTLKHRTLSYFPDVTYTHHVDIRRERAPGWEVVVDLHEHLVIRRYDPAGLGQTETVIAQPGRRPYTLPVAEWFRPSYEQRLAARVEWVGPEPVAQHATVSVNGGPPMSIKHWSVIARDRA